MSDVSILTDPWHAETPMAWIWHNSSVEVPKKGGKRFVPNVRWETTHLVRRKMLCLIIDREVILRVGAYIRKKKAA